MGFLSNLTKNALSLLKHFCEHILDTLKRKQNRIFAPAHSIWQNFALREESEFVPFLIISRTRETTLFRSAPPFVRKHFREESEFAQFYMVCPLKIAQRERKRR